MSIIQKIRSLLKPKRRVNYITFDLRQKRFEQAVLEDDMATMKKLLKR